MTANTYGAGIAVSLLLSLAALDVEAAELGEAAKRQDWGAVRMLLEQGAEVDATLVDGSTALHWAVQFDEIETARLLIDAGASVALGARLL